MQAKALIALPRPELDGDHDGSRGSPAMAEVSAVIEGLGAIADRLGNRAAVAQYEADIGDPQRTRSGTALAAHTGPLPRFLPMRDIVRISFNLYDLVPADAILRRLARSTRVPTDDNLTNTLPYAPNLQAALDLGMRYGNAMLPWFCRSLEVRGDELHVVYRPVTPLGRIEALSTELSLAATHRTVETFVGPQVAEARIHFARPPVSDPLALAERFACPVAVGGGTSHMAVPLAWCDRPSPYHDARLWADGLARCAADIGKVEDAPVVSRVRGHVQHALEHSRAVTLEDSSLALGMSVRSLVRALAGAGTTHHRIADAERRDQARQLLVYPALPLAEVAEMLGFPDQSSFGRKCRRWFGDSPARVRRKRLAADG